MSKRIEDEVDSLFEARRKILAHVNYRERWRDFPFEDSREQHWAINGFNDVVEFSPDREALVYGLTNDDYGEYADKLYANAISTREGEPGVYRGAELTIVVADTRIDGNVFLQIFRNTNEIVRCACGALPQYVADGGEQRCRECMLKHQVAAHHARQKDKP